MRRYKVAPASSFLNDYYGLGPLSRIQARIPRTGRTWTKLPKLGMLWPSTEIWNVSGNHISQNTCFFYIRFNNPWNIHVFAFRYHDNTIKAYDSRNIFTHILQGCFAKPGTQCQWSSPKYGWNWLVRIHNRSDQSTCHVATNSFPALFGIIYTVNDINSYTLLMR